MRAAIVQLIDSLPSIDEMRKHLLRKVNTGKSKPKLREIDPDILPAAWLVLRWILGSCTAHLEEITNQDEILKNIGKELRFLARMWLTQCPADPIWKQYRFSVGAPDAEAKFKASVQNAQQVDMNCVNFPSIFGFHGSPLRNWHSIIRHGLWFKDVAHGRAFGNGVYLAKDGSVSMGGYTGQNRSSPWRKSRVSPVNCVALVEIVNQPSHFISNNPYYVVQHTHWLICRYLLVKCSLANDSSSDKSSLATNDAAPPPHVKLDPKQPVTMNNQAIEIPEPGYQIDLLLQARRHEYQEEDNDEEDRQVFEYTETISTDKGKGRAPNNASADEDIDIEMMDASNMSSGERRPADDWVHDAEYVIDAIANLLPPPTLASPSATMSVQRELRYMLKEQENATSLKELGWYLPQDLLGDNLFQWILELHSFDDSLPIAQDMKKA
ncbi:hypothetical protein VNI00_000494 [Paramarasmius palmivorus]|uniref:PARP catalytic domain-containing protein n=1 Tax=Paramarasmius palmivorus TaxID=297713 RepID=A0AAW0E9F6_9AGAR